MISAQTNERKVPLSIVGGTTFGRYAKISVAQTWNMIVSDDFLVDYAGFAAVLQLVADGIGRGAYTSTHSNRAIAVVSSSVFVIIPGLSSQFVGSLNTSIGNVFIAENNNGEIAITDYSNIYVYSYLTTPPKFSVSTTNVSPPPGQFTVPSTLTAPGYITFQNGRLIVAATGTTEWILSDFNNALLWTGSTTYVGTLQTKPDTVQAPVAFPGRGNLLFVFGFTVAESWTDQAQVLFPYVKSTTFNLDYGCLNPATIAANKNYIVWIAQNEHSGPSLMYTDGSNIERISTDGIDYQLSSLTAPTDCYGFFFEQDGHLLYQFAFPTDNISYAYDFNTKKFFTVSDENLNYHPAKQVIFFDGVYYFVSNKDGNFYEFDTSQTNYTYLAADGVTKIVKEIPRIRICPPIRLDTQQSFIAKDLSFTIEQGQPNNITYIDVPQPLSPSLITTDAGYIILTTEGFAIQTTNYSGSLPFPISQAGVDLSLSRDGGETFGSSWRLNMNETGKRKSLFIYRQLGRVNDLTPQLRFWGFNRFVVTDGIVSLSN